MRAIVAMAWARWSRDVASTAGFGAYCLGTALAARSRSASVSDSETKDTERGAFSACVATVPTLYVTVDGGDSSRPAAVSNPVARTNTHMRVRGAVSAVRRSITLGGGRNRRI